MNTIVFIEDNTDMALAIVKYFGKQNFYIDHFSSFSKAKSSLRANEYQCYLLDLNLPQSSGYDAARFIRTINSKAPILAVTARSAIDDKLKAFDHGFTDYIVKPFDLRELMARVKAHIGQLANQDSEKIEVGRFVINRHRYEAKFTGRNLSLTKLEFNLLFCLLENAGLLVKTDDLVEAAWGLDSEILTPPIRMHISHLRTKLGDKDYRIIETVPGLGYKLNP